MKIEKTIVFGATGQVGSNAVLKAHKLGAEVTLALRDPKKAIPGLSPDDEKAGKYKRVQADLTKPDTVQAAVKQSGAKSAFVYLVWGQNDHMLSTFQALKDAGIDLVVLLSSAGVPDKQKQMEALDESNLIPYAHAQAELALAKVFSKEQYVALRPGFFATNVLMQKFGIIAGSVRLLRPEVTWDYITPEDIGEAAGNILARGQRDGQNVVPLFGPDELMQREAFLKIGKAIGKEIIVAEATEDEARESLAAAELPEGVINQLVTQLVDRKQGEGVAPKKKLSEGQANVEKYAARPGMRLDDWTTKNIDMFATKVEDVATAMPESAPEPEEPEEEEEVEKEGEADGEKKDGEDGEGEAKDDDDDDEKTEGKKGKK